MRIIPITLRQANAFIIQFHRHHKPVVGMKFAIGLEDCGNLIGIVIVGRPVARGLDDKFTCEVTRLCTDGTSNACSMLYSAAWRAAKAMGYTKCVTYILDFEPGISLKATGWVHVADTNGGSWNCASRTRVDKAPICPKQRWEIKVN